MWAIPPGVSSRHIMAPTRHSAGCNPPSSFDPGRGRGLCLRVASRYVESRLDLHQNNAVPCVHLFAALFYCDRPGTSSAGYVVATRFFLIALLTKSVTPPCPPRAGSFGGDAGNSDCVTIFPLVPWSDWARRWGLVSAHVKRSNRAQGSDLRTIVERFCRGGRCGFLWETICRDLYLFIRCGKSTRPRRAVVFRIGVVATLAIFVRCWYDFARHCGALFFGWSLFPDARLLQCLRLHVFVRRGSLAVSPSIGIACAAGGRSREKGTIVSALLCAARTPDVQRSGCMRHATFYARRGRGTDAGVAHNLGNLLLEDAISRRDRPSKRPAYDPNR